MLAIIDVNSFRAKNFAQTLSFMTIVELGNEREENQTQPHFQNETINPNSNNKHGQNTQIEKKETTHKEKKEEQKQQSEEEKNLHFLLLEHFCLLEKFIANYLQQHKVPSKQ